ncbi:MAG: ABC transporter ATP-binding protein [Verrucomicrobiota bacterium]|nr:ABC transporter ATP-binding protein [Verrucomicrobiota bacterium]
MVSITIDKVSKSFGRTLALNKISLHIKAGELFFLLGSSGCGKTTLLRHIAGFYSPDKGKILFGTDDVTSTPPHKRNAAMMFQSYALWPHMTVAKNVAFGLEEQGKPKSQIKDLVAEALDTVKMAGYSERKINELSGGQQQRAALARALIVRPRCLLLDEPLSNLDAKLRLEMRSEIRRICKESGLTAVYVTHDQKEALSIADRIAILDSGSVEQVGSAKEIYCSPRSRSVAGFIGETNFIAGTVTGCKTDSQVDVETPLGQFTGRTSDPDWHPRSGDTITISIRPEAFRLTESRPEVNGITGQLASLTYLGEIAQYGIKAEGGSMINIAELNPQVLHQPGESLCHASVDKDDVVIISN